MKYILTCVFFLLFSNSAFSYTCGSNCKSVTKKCAFGACVNVPNPEYPICTAGKALACLTDEANELAKEKNKLLKHYERVLTVKEAEKSTHKALKSTKTSLVKKSQILSRDLNRLKSNSSAALKSVAASSLKVTNVVNDLTTGTLNIAERIVLEPISSNLKKGIEESSKALIKAKNALSKTPTSKALAKSYVDAREGLRKKIDLAKKSLDRIYSVSSDAVYQTGEDAAAYWGPRWGSLEDSVMASIDEDTCEYKEEFRILGDYPSKQRECFDRRSLAIEAKTNKIREKIEDRRKLILDKFNKQLKAEF